MRVEIDWKDQNNGQQVISADVGEKITSQQLEYAIESFNTRFESFAFIFKDELDKANGETCLVIWKVFPKPDPGGEYTGPFLDEYEARKYLNELKQFTEMN